MKMLEFPLRKDRNIFLYYLYSALYGLYPINAIVSLFFISRGLGFAEIGVVVAVFQITGIAFEIPTGYIADRLGRRTSVLLGLLLLVLTTSLWTFAQNYLQFAGLAFIWMLGFTCISGSFEAYIYDYLKEKSLLDNYDSVLSRATSLSFFFAAIGSIVGAWLFSLRIELPYYAQILTFFSSFIAVLFMENDAQKIKILLKDKAKPNLLSGFARIFKTPQLLWIAIFISGFYAYFMYFLNSTNAPYLLETKVIDVKFLGLFFAIMALYQAALSHNFARLKKKLSDNMLIGALMVVQIFALIGLAYFVGWFGILAYIMFVSIEPFETLLINGFSQKYAESEVRATTISTIKMINAVFAAIVGVLSGILFDKVGMSSGFLVVAVLLSVFSVFMMRLKFLFKVRL